jgi:hypothetical protein
VTLELKVRCHFLSLFYILTVKHLFFCSAPHSPVRVSKNSSSQHTPATQTRRSCTLPPPKRTHPLPQAQCLVHLHVSWMMTMTKASHNHSLLSRPTASSRFKLLPRWILKIIKCTRLVPCRMVVGTQHYHSSILTPWLCLIFTQLSFSSL